MKKIFLLFVLAVGMIMNAQVGINTTSPNATLDIKAKTDGSTRPEGLLIPSLTDDQIGRMSVTSAQKGMMVYNSSKDCIQAYTANQWKCMGEGAGNGSTGIAQYLNVTYAGATGTWIQNIATSGNTVRFQIANNSSMSFANLNFNNAVSLAGASGGLTVAPAADYSNTTISAGNTVTLTYTVTGTPATAGTLTANFSANGLSAYGNITIAPQSQVQATSIAFAGTYVSNTSMAGNSVKLTISNYSGTSLTGVNMSNAVSLSGLSGVSIAQNQNTSVNIPTGSTTVLTYNLTGAATQPGTLTATFTPNPQVSGNASASQTVALFSNVDASNMVINGTYMYGQNMTPSNTITLTVTNNNAFALQGIDLGNAITLSGANATLSVAAGQNTAVNIPANSSVTLTYNLSGSSNVVAGGTLTATFTQAPFPTLTATKQVMGNLGFYATPNATTLHSSGGTYTFQITSASPWTYALDSSASMNGWVVVSGTTGTDGNGTITVKTNPKTAAQAPQIGYINITQPGTGATIQIAINQAPTDAFQITGFTSQAPNVTLGEFGSISQYWLSIHSSKTSTMTTNQTNLGIYGATPAIVQSLSFNGNQIVYTPTERTDGGVKTPATIRFSYGQGYLSDPIAIYQNQKAYKCPSSSPVRADQGYKVWNSTQKFKGLFNALIETRSGVDSFTDYSPDQGYDMNDGSIYGTDAYYYNKRVVQNTGSSTLFYDVRNNYGDPNAGLSSFSSQSSLFRRPSIYYKYAFLWMDNKFVHEFNTDSDKNDPFNPTQTAKVITPVICADGYDEDTPNVADPAGWRQ